MNSAPSRQPSITVFNILLLGIIAVMLFYLLTEHTAHFFGVLPWIFLLACPLMMMFMHRKGWHSHGEHEDNETYDRHEYTQVPKHHRQDKTASQSSSGSIADVTTDPEQKKKQSEHHHSC